MAFKSVVTFESDKGEPPARKQTRSERLRDAEGVYDQRPVRYRFGATIRKRLRAEPPDIGSDVPGGGAV